MTHTFYGKKTFIADLLIVSLWALFALHTAGWIFIVRTMILMRIGLCFELYHRSRWAFSGSIFFAITYIACISGMPSTSPAVEPMKHLVYVVGSLGGFSDYLQEIYYHGCDHRLKFLWWVIWSLVSFWLVLMPFVWSWPNKSAVSIYRTKRKLWWFWGCVIFISIWICIDEPEVALFIFSALMSLSPLVYYILYRKFPVLQRILDNRVFMSYCGIAITVLTTIYIGLYNVGHAKALAAIIAPVVLYVITMRLNRIRPIKSLPVVLFSIAGLTYINVYDRVHELVIVLLAAGGAISLVASYLTFRQTKSLLGSSLLFIASTFILPIFLLGYNPYAVINADNVHTFGKNRGLYQIEYHGKKGLRDRYGIVIEPCNQSLYYIDDHKKYVAVKVCYDSPYTEVEYGVYCIPERRFVVEPRCGIDSIAQIDSRNFKMIDATGRHFGTFKLPVCNINQHESNVEFEAHYSDFIIPISEFLDHANNSALCPGGNRYWQWMSEKDPDAFSLLGKILAMSTIDSSPENDLSFARAVTIIINNNTRYKGDVGEALNGIDRILETLSAGNQPELNQWASIKRLISSLRLSLEYDSYVAMGNLYHDEYTAWHNLMEAIVYYYDYVKSYSDWYGCMSMDMELQKDSWLENRRSMLDVEQKIINGNGIYTVDNLLSYYENERRHSYEDVQREFRDYYFDNHPGYYNPVWYEIKPALEKWYAIRREISNTLPDNKRSDYDIITSLLVSEYTGIVLSLSGSGLVPAM